MLFLKKYPSNSTLLDNIWQNHIIYTEIVIKIPRSVLSQPLFLQMIRVWCSVFLALADSNHYHRTVISIS